MSGQEGGKREDRRVLQPYVDGSKGMRNGFSAGDTGRQAYPSFYVARTGPRGGLCNVKPAGQAGVVYAVLFLSQLRVNRLTFNR